MLAQRRPSTGSGLSRSNTLVASSKPREYMKKQADCFAAAFGETAQMEDSATLNEEDYPLTRFWQHENFKKFLAANPGASRTSFLEDEDGNLIPEAMASDIRSVLRTKFRDSDVRARLGLEARVLAWLQEAQAL